VGADPARYGRSVTVRSGAVARFAVRDIGRPVEGTVIPSPTVRVTDFSPEARKPPPGGGAVDGPSGFVPDRSGALQGEGALTRPAPGAGPARADRPSRKTGF